MNATIKSGTNSFHGTVWEFFRNDKMDAADYFERRIDTTAGTNTTKKGELRQNQYGFSIGGPVVIPHLFDGRNKVFFFGDYEGFRRRLGVPHTGGVPTAQERSSGYTNFQELLQTGTQTDALGRTMPFGTILDPATTRTAGSGVVRDPFTTTPACVGAGAGFTYSLATCPDLNILPADRLDPNAIALLDLYPAPTGSGISSNYAVSPKLKEDRQSFDTRLDVNFSSKDQTFSERASMDARVFAQHDQRRTRRPELSPHDTCFSRGKQPH